jgi:hypothetical protein
MTFSSSNADATNWNQANNLARDFKNDQAVRVIKDEDGTRVVILDKNGLRTTAVGGGIDVFTATNGQLTFNSAQNTFKIAAHTGVLDSSGGSFLVPAGEIASLTKVDSYAHGLTFTPTLIGAVLNGSNYSTLPLQTFIAPTTTTALTANLYMAADSTYVSTYVTCVGDARGSAGGLSVTVSSFPFRLYLLQETAN